jgi:hypothetical protein
LHCVCLNYHEKKIDKHDTFRKSFTVMNYPSVYVALLGLTLPLFAKEVERFPQAGAQGVSIPCRISDGKPSEPSPPPEVPCFTVTESRSQRINVVESPPMPGLPPVTGTVSVTVKKVLDPALLGLTSPLPAARPEDPVVLARFKELQKSYRGTQMVFVSATTYGHSRTYLQVYPNGQVDEQVAAWSNLDFHHFSGFSMYRVTEADGTYTNYGLLLGVSRMDTVRWATVMAEHGRDHTPLEIPHLANLATHGPSYVVVEGKDSGSDALETLHQLHELYRKEGSRMEKAYYARRAEEARQRAWYLANPPKPKDLVLHYWRGKRPENQGGGL